MYQQHMQQNAASIFYMKKNMPRAWHYNNLFYWQTSPSQTLSHSRWNSKNTGEVSKGTFWEALKDYLCGQIIFYSLKLIDCKQNISLALLIRSQIQTIILYLPHLTCTKTDQQMTPLPSLVLSGWDYLWLCPSHYVYRGRTVYEHHTVFDRKH